MGIISFSKRVLRKLRFTKATNWKEIEYFNSDWKNRIGIMTQFIKPGDSVLDLGCGEMWLRELLPKGCIYIPVDYTTRKEGETIVCDFNKGEFPEMKVNVAFLSGSFEYVVDYTSFVGNLNRYSDRVIISYVSMDIQPDMGKRNRNAWKNHLDRNQFLKVFVRNGFILDKTVSDGRFVIYHFIKHN